MPAHLLLRLEAPLMSFGAVAVDHRRPVQAWPAVSMLTGLFGNALGWTRLEAQRLNALQARIRWAARIERPGQALEDFQTAQLKKDDKAWTSRNAVESRQGGEETYKSPHLRYRDFRADASVLVAVRLEPPEPVPSLADLAEALDRPRRPLFLGRKACPPATRIALGVVEGQDAVAVLDGQASFLGTEASRSAGVYSNESSAVTAGWRVHRVSDQRRFDLDVHAGSAPVYERVGRLSP